MKWIKIENIEDQELLLKYRLVLFYRPDVNGCDLMRPVFLVSDDHGEKDTLWEIENVDYMSLNFNSDIKPFYTHYSVITFPEREQDGKSNI